MTSFALTVRDGAVSWDKDAFVSTVRGLRPGRYVLTLTKETRSSEANRYLFGVVYKTIADELGYSVDEIHDAMKDKFRSREDPSTGLKIVRSTITDGDDFWQYVNEIKMWARTFLCIELPDPNERAA